MIGHVLFSTLFVSAVFNVPTIHAVTAKQPKLQQILACSDRTFAYNSFNIERSDERYYVSLKGSRLVKEGKFFIDNDAEYLQLRGDIWSGLNHTYHVSFLHADCLLGSNGVSLTCNKGDLMIDSHDESFYRTRRIDDLGIIRVITSKFPAQRLELYASSDGLTLKKLQRYVGTGEIETQTITIKAPDFGENDPQSLDCRGSNSFIPHVAPALVEHLEPEYLAPK